MSDYTPTTDEIVEAVVYHQTRKGFDGMGTVGREEAVSRVTNWLAEVERAAAEKAWWEACLRITIGEDNLDIAHEYQKKNPYLEGES